MAKAKKGEIAIQEYLDDDEQWQAFLKKEGLLVIDVYQEWCGPCRPIQPYFRRWKLDLNSPILHFAVAKCNKIPVLQNFLGKCRPVFLFFGSGYLVEIVRDCHPPVIQRRIYEELEKETKVLERLKKRKIIKIPEFDLHLGRKDTVSSEGTTATTTTSIKTSHPSEPRTTEDRVTICIIKPNVIKDGKVDEVITKIKEIGLDIIERLDSYNLSQAEVEGLYKKKNRVDARLVEYMISGPVHVLVLASSDELLGVDVVEKFREILGAKTVEEAKEKNPGSLRALYGINGFKNGVHGSDSHEAATKELELFFPEFKYPTPILSLQSVTAEQQELQRTIGIIRPDALRIRRDEILQKVRMMGFTFDINLEDTFSREKILMFYENKKEEPYYEELVTYMCSGPILVLVLIRENAVEAWRKAVGPWNCEEAWETSPNSLRAKYIFENTPLNQFHGSDSMENAIRDYEFFFPSDKTLAVIKPNVMLHKQDILDRVVKAGYEITDTKELTLTTDQAEKLYTTVKEKPFFAELVEFMISGPSLFLIVQKEDAVNTFHSWIGPTHPEDAKLVDPECIRAEYGVDGIRNAIHAASNCIAVYNNIKMIFEQDFF